MNYYYATGDQEWLRRNYPLLREVAVYHASRVTKGPLPPSQESTSALGLASAKLGSAGTEYHVLGAMGPDEYNFNVSDPAFTMAVMQITLRFAAEAAAIAGDSTAPTALWLDIAEHLMIPQFNATLGFTPEYRGYPPARKEPGRNPDIKQADQLMMTYPLNCNQTKEAGLANARYYSRKSPNGPAMTWPINTIAFLRGGDPTAAAKYFNDSFADYREEPFGVWSEMHVGGGRSHFVTGPGGFLQSLINGYSGVQLGPESLGLRMTLPVGVPSLALRNVHYRGHSFSAKLSGGVVTITPVRGGSGLVAIGSDGVKRELTAPLTFKPNEPIELRDVAMQ